jgi:hypothetical protein
MTRLIPGWPKCRGGFEDGLFVSRLVGSFAYRRRAAAQLIEEIQQEGQGVDVSPLAGIAARCVLGLLGN